MGHDRRKWTPQEDEIVLALEPAEAGRQLPHRTHAAILTRKSQLRCGIENTKNFDHFTEDEIETVRAMWPAAKNAAELKLYLPSRTARQISDFARRHNLKHGVPAPPRRARGRHRPWSSEEDELIKRLLPTAAQKLLPRRTRAAIKTRRNLLLNGGIERIENHQRLTAAEVNIIRKLWPTPKDVKDVMRHVPGRTAAQIRGAARTRGVRRLYLGDHNARIEGHLELVDQIKIRAKQDGITIKRLDAVLGTGTFFKGSFSDRKRVNLKNVAKAVEFFGGTLVIDWRDR